MHHVALDWAGPNNRHFNHDIIKTFRFHARQRRHLRATLDLENANGVCALHNCKSRRIIFWNVSQIERSPPLAAKLQRILHYRHHPEPEQIDLHNAEVFAIVFVPLRDNAAGH